jgi:hypothetical protein
MGSWQMLLSTHQITLGKKWPIWSTAQQRKQENLQPEEQPQKTIKCRSPTPQQQSMAARHSWVGPGETAKEKQEPGAGSAPQSSGANHIPENGSLLQRTSSEGPNCLQSFPQKPMVIMRQGRGSLQTQVLTGSWLAPLALKLRKVLSLE